jgi:two-component system aerobic respiration control sensor histidine kinase ArcB
MSFNKDLELFNKIIHVVPGNIYWKDREGRYLGCNDNQLKIARLSSLEDIVGKTDFDLYDRELAKKVHAVDERVMRTGKPLKFEEQGINEKGIAAIYLTDKQPLFDENHKVYGLIGISIDITEKKMAEQLKAMKSAFIQNMEHDVRTPCGGIWGMVDYLWKTESDPVKKESLGLVTEAAKELLDYNNRIIEFAQMQAEKWPIVAKQLEIQELLKKVVALEHPAALYKHIDLSLGIDPEIPPHIISDDHRLYCIAVNLISNAIKFTEIGGVQIKLNTKNINVSKRSAILRLEVKDTGIGISQDMQNLIYTPFNRLNPSNQNKYRGLGLGLAMVKQFIEELEGELEVSSEVGKGTTISCTIPVKLPLAENVESKEEHKSDHP